MGVGMSDEWLWCSCTTARTWCESLASCSDWLYDQLEAQVCEDPGDWGPDGVATESTSAPYWPERGAISGTTTTRLPAAWSASNSW